jgi:hypothetical protein
MRETLYGDGVQCRTISEIRSHTNTSYHEQCRPYLKIQSTPATCTNNLIYKKKKKKKKIKKSANAFQEKNCSSFSEP